MITIYTDGACIPNPGAGGWGFAAYNSDNHCIYRDCGGLADTTNNVMELTAIIKALEYLQGSVALVYSDSQYCINGLNDWRHKWKKSGWRRGQSALANADLWRRLDLLADASQATFKWIKGHNGHFGNDHADRLAELGRTGKFVDEELAA